MDGFHALAFLLGLLVAGLALALGYLLARPRDKEPKAIGLGVPEPKGCWEGVDDASLAERGEAPKSLTGQPSSSAACRDVGAVAADEKAVTVGEACKVLRGLLAGEATCSGRAADLLAQLEGLPSGSNIGRTTDGAKPVKETPPAGKLCKGSLLREAATEEEASTTMSTTLRPVSAATIDSASTGQTSLEESVPPLESALPGQVKEFVPPTPAPQPPAPPSPPHLQQAFEGVPPPDATPSPLGVASDAFQALPAATPGANPPRPLEDRNLELGPTPRQQIAQDPPETRRGPLAVEEEEGGLRVSLTTVQRVLGRRDAQITDLHRQLRQLRQELFNETANARVASGKVQLLLTDPSRVPVEQAEELRRHQLELSNLSIGLADMRRREQHWRSIVKQQRHYMMQSEHIHQQEAHDPNVVKRHPAGELFVAMLPPPPDEEELAQQQLRQGIAQSYCDPYSVDSWPFEPNSLAARNTYEPQFQDWEEGDEFSDQDLDDEFEDDGGESLDGIEQDRSPSWRQGPSGHQSGDRPQSARSL